MLQGGLGSRERVDHAHAGQGGLGVKKNKQGLQAGEDAGAPCVAFLESLGDQEGRPFGDLLDQGHEGLLDAAESIGESQARDPCLLGHRRDCGAVQSALGHNLRHRLEDAGPLHLHYLSALTTHGATVNMERSKQSMFGSNV